MQIKRLTPNDTVSYRSMMLEAYARHPDAFLSSVGERSVKPLSWWQERLDPSPNAQQLVYGARVDDKLVGVVGIGFDMRAKARHKANVFGMYVRAQGRRQGIGKALLSAALDQARQREGVRIVQLTVTEGNDMAEALYAMFGFRRFGVEPMAGRVGDVFIAKVHMWCDLA